MLRPTINPSPIRRITCAFLVFALPTLIYAQQNPSTEFVDLANPDQERAYYPPEAVEVVIDTPSGLPAWRDLRPKEHISMRFALGFAEEIDTNIDENFQLSAHDLAILKSSMESFSTIASRVSQHTDKFCLEYLNGVYTGSDMAQRLAEQFALGEQIEAEDTIAFFEHTLSLLSLEGQQVMRDFQQKIYREDISSNSMDWIKFAELEPELFLGKVSRICGSR